MIVLLIQPTLSFSTSIVMWKSLKYQAATPQRHASMPALYYTGTGKIWSLLLARYATTMDVKIWSCISRIRRFCLSTMARAFIHNEAIQYRGFSVAVVPKSLAFSSEIERSIDRLL